MNIVILTAAAVLLIVAFITDVSKQIIPNRLTIFFFGAGVLFHLIAGGIHDGAAAVAGAAAGFVPLLLLHLAKGIGAGDVKLFGALGAWIGVGAVLQLLLYSILYAGLIGVVIAVIYRSFSGKMTVEMTALLLPGDEPKKRQWLRFADSGKKFPFMLAVLPAAVTVRIMLG
ncbi:A24 family peptidase [Paenibacillus harenae]|uniref:A24 family peptidase n=1 Tax=Paenibacillus harenae TaxID=306543 RepID=UPI0027902422|nr:A24 family peptidase [Paenibacillus harenae]MDQ0060964.1 prepilin peptidase CpaA [Paenibacillus harenae]